MGGIFISYRREDSAGHAGRIYDRLSDRFGRDKVFMDVAGIEPGVDFVEAIDRAVGSCDVLLVIIGNKWLSCTDAAGKRRLDDPQDFIRLETATALKRGIRVVPVLVQKAIMPTEDDLPDDLKALARRQATEIDDTHWDSDTGQLIETLAKLLPGETKPTPRETVRESSPPPAEESLPTSNLPPWMGKNKLAWIISSITALVVALGGLLSTIESYRDTFSKFFGSEQKVVQEIPASRPAPEPEPKPEPHRPVPEKPVEPEKHESAKPAVMPNLVGQPLEKAHELVRKAGLKTGEPHRVETADVPEGTVVEQSPRAGTRLMRGKTVEMVMAVAPRQPEMIEVPDVAGRPVKEAVAVLTEAGLVVDRKMKREETSKVEPNTVLRQSLKPGSRVRPKEIISLVFAIAPRERDGAAPREVVLPAPIQAWPEDGRIFDNYPRNAAVLWEPVRGAVSYTVELDCLHCCVKGEWCSDLGKPWKIVRNIPPDRAPGYKFEFVGAQRGRWRVWAVDKSGGEGEKSSWRTFRYVK